MISSVSREMEEIFSRFITTEYTTIDRHLQPITWPVTPYHSAESQCISVTTGIGFPKKADDAAANPKVALLFSEPKGSGLARPSTVLVQGFADVDDRDFTANRERYTRESRQKLPGAFSNGMLPPVPFKRVFGWYYLTRIYVHVRPLRIFVWPEGDFARQPDVVIVDSDPLQPLSIAPPERNSDGTESQSAWDARIEELGRRYDNAVLSFVDGDGFPFSVRVPVSVDHAARKISIASPGDVAEWLRPGLACLTAHDHDPDFAYMRSFQVRGQLSERDGAWTIRPQKLIGGFEMPPTSHVSRHAANLRTMLRYRRTARRVLATRGGRRHGL